MSSLPRSVFVPLVLGCALLAGCEGAVTARLSTDAPADPQVSNVTTGIAGIEFERSDGTTEKIEAGSASHLNLLNLQNDTLNLFTDAPLPEGAYTGLRLLTSDTNGTAYVLRSDGRDFPLKLSDGSYTPIDFTVEKDKANRASFALSLDLRQSLSYDADAQEYTLTPVLRSTPGDKAAQIEGTVSVACPIGTSLQNGGAVYLFSGKDIDPDDIGSSTGPYATTAIVTDLFAGQYTYALRFLPAGDYTLAVTCNGDIDAPDSDDDVTFVGTANITIDDSQQLTLNLDAQSITSAASAP